MKITKGMSLVNNARRYTRKTVAGLLSVVFFAACCPIAFAAEEPDAPLTPDELAGMTHEEIAAISQEQSDATLNKMVQLWQDGEMDTLDEYYAALGFATTYEEYEEQQEEQELEDQVTLEPKIQPLWQSTDPDDPQTEKMGHEGITTGGFLLYLGARNQLFGGATSGYTLSDMQLLASEVGRPDHSIQVGFFFAGHFYNPDTNANYLGDSTNTAKTNAQFYYDYAVKKYQEGNRTEAIKNLSYCLHYIQDAGEPHHASNLLAGSSNHSEFEALATEMLYNDIEIDTDAIPELDFYNTFNTLPITASTHTIATTAKEFKDAATNEDNIAGQRLSAALLLLYSMQNTSGVLYKFAKEVHLIN